MSDFETTQEFYSDDDGVYHSDRQEKHQEILGIFFKNDINPLKPAEAILFGGGSASGKSTMRDFFIEDYKAREIPVVVIDSDAIKEHIPEYKDKLVEDKKNAAKYVHDESSDMSNILLNRCLDESKNFIYDGTMKNLEKYQNIIKQAKEKGFKITIVVVDVPLEIAKQRAFVRSKLTGREVPMEELEKSHREVPVVFENLKDMVDEYMLIDMSNDVPGEEPHEFICIKEDGKEIVLNQEKYEQFLKKGGI